MKKNASNVSTNCNTQRFPSFKKCREINTNIIDSSEVIFVSSSRFDVPSSFYYLYFNKNSTAKKTQCVNQRFEIEDCRGRMLLLVNAFGRHQMIDRRRQGSLDLFSHDRSSVMACSFVPLANVQYMLKFWLWSCVCVCMCLVSGRHIV